jgi:hypothetical protein
MSADFAEGVTDLLDPTLIIKSPLARFFFNFIFFIMRVAVQVRAGDWGGERSVEERGGEERDNNPNTFFYCHKALTNPNRLLLPRAASHPSQRARGGR